MSPQISYFTLRNGQKFTLYTGDEYYSYTNHRRKDSTLSSRDIYYKNKFIPQHDTNHYR